MKSFTADFETLTTVEDFTYVWLWCIYDIKKECYIVGNTIEKFFTELEKIKKDCEIFIHNLKFDGSFILNYLLKNGIEKIERFNKVLMSDNKKYFTCLISGMNNFYAIELKLRVGVKIIFKNSLNLMPFSLESIANQLDLPVKKGSIDYAKFRFENHTATNEEIDYVVSDCYILAQAIKRVVKGKGMVKLTLGSNALAIAKLMVGFESYKELYPSLNEPEEKISRKSYTGGYCYINTDSKHLNHNNEYYGSGCCLDINSVYPYMLANAPLPFGYPRRIATKLKEFKKNKLYIIQFISSFKLKKNCIPTIQIKNSWMFCPNEYVKDSFGEKFMLTMTNVDFYHFKKNYDILSFEWKGGLEFNCNHGIFKQFVNDFSDMKIKAKKENNKNDYMYAKLMMNSLTGKFATNPDSEIKIPFLEDEILKFKYEETSVKKEYVPLTAFITAWSRHLLFNTIYKLGVEYFLYADTDSIHIALTEKVVRRKISTLIDSSKLGKFDLEYSFIKARYIKQKTYIEVKQNGEEVVRCAGLSKKYHSYLNFENFKSGIKIPDVLKARQVKGGVILKKYEHEIKL